MPPRRTRRNPDPDPDQGLAEYLEQVFAEALKAEGVLVSKTSEAYFDYLAFGGEHTLAVLRSGERFEFYVGPLWLFPKEYDVEFLTFGVQVAVLMNREGEQPYDIENVAEVVEKAANATRLLVSLNVNLNVRDSRVYVPKGFIGKAPLSISVRNDARSTTRISRAATEQHFPNVPRPYRKQVSALLQHAYKNDDLVTYLQAKELAALVAE